MTSVRGKIDETTYYFSYGIFLDPDISREKIEMATQQCMNVIERELKGRGFELKDLGKKWNVIYTRQFAQPIGMPTEDPENDHWWKRRLSVSAYLFLL